MSGELYNRKRRKGGYGWQNTAGNVGGHDDAGNSSIRFLYAEVSDMSSRLIILMGTVFFLEEFIFQ